MRTFADYQRKLGAEKHSAGIHSQSLGAMDLSARLDSFTLHRKASCACGGSCPSCRSCTSGLKVSHPNDAAGTEADDVANRVMRTPDKAAKAIAKHASSPDTIHRKCGECDEQEEKTIQRKPLSLSGSSSAQTPGHVGSAIGSGGQQLDFQTRNFFEPRLGYDLSGVRVHTGSSGSESARAVDARAYTLGNNIVFGSGEYDPLSDGGKHLLAHELAHVAQNSERVSGETMHRKLIVDAASSDDPKTAVSMMDPLIKGLCPDSEIDATDEVVPKAGSACTATKLPNYTKIAGGAHPLGCCCLCTFVRGPGSPWKIIVSSTDAPTTSSGKRTVRMTPTSGPAAPELRHWSAGPIQTTSTQQPVEALGHELCGHAALMQIKAHPDHSLTDRSYSDEHDTTVRIQNALAAEMGLGGTRRGLAGSGTHRGESLRVFTVGPFAANKD